MTRITKDSLEISYPELVKEWHPTKNSEMKSSEVTAGSSRKVWWKCSKGHEWQAVISSRAKSNRGCPYCSGRKAVEGKNDILTTHPDIAKEWDYIRNGDNKPTEYSYGSGKRVWWICPKGHAYEQTISRRCIRGANCPYCSGHKVLKGYNDLNTKNPDLAKEWHPTKNGNLKPWDVTPGTGKKVWWLCPKGHEYQASVNDRNGRRGTNCPICKEYMQTSFPEQAIYYYVSKIHKDALNRSKDILDGKLELDIYIPSVKVAIEFDGANWHNSEKQHERERKKYRLCRKKGIYLIRVKEQNGDKWHDTADQFYFINKVKKYDELSNVIRVICDSIDLESNMWTRKNPYMFHSTVDINLSRDRKEILYYLTDVSELLAEKRPDVVKMWDYERNGDLQPTMFSVSSNQKVYWKCPDCGHEWESSINSMTRDGRYGCAECSKIRRGKTFTQGKVKEVGSLAETMPELAKEWHPTKNGDLTPYDITAGRFKQVWWQCSKCGYEWEASPSNRKKGVGCPCCSGRVPKTGANDLQFLFPKLMEEWDYDKNGNLDPSKLLPGSGKRAWWICKECGNNWETVVRNRTKGHGCPKCSKKKQTKKL